MRISRTTAVPATVMCLTLAVAGCGAAGGEPDSGPTADTSTDTSPIEPTDGGSSEPDVPDDWKVASIDVAQLQVPPDWSITSIGDMSQSMSAPVDEIGASPGSGHILASPDRIGQDDPDRLERKAKTYGKSLAKELTILERLPNETINGSVFFHFRGEDDIGFWRDVYGTAPTGGEYQVIVTWDFRKSDIDRKGADKLIAQVMATYKVL